MAVYWAAREDSVRIATGSRGLFDGIALQRRQGEGMLHAAGRGVMSALGAPLATLQVVASMAGAELQGAVRGRPVATSRLPLDRLLGLARTGCSFNTSHDGVQWTPDQTNVTMTGALHGGARPTDFPTEPIFPPLDSRDWQKLCRLAAESCLLPSNGVTSDECKNGIGGFGHRMLVARGILARDPLFPVVATGASLALEWAMPVNPPVEGLAKGGEGEGEGEAGEREAGRDADSGSVEWVRDASLGAAFVVWATLCLGSVTMILQPLLAVCFEVAWAGIVVATARPAEVRESVAAAALLASPGSKKGSEGRSAMHQLMIDVLPDIDAADMIVHRRAD